MPSNFKSALQTESEFDRWFQGRQTAEITYETSDPAIPSTATIPWDLICSNRKIYASRVLQAGPCDKIQVSNRSKIFEWIYYPIMSTVHPLAPLWSFLVAHISEFWIATIGTFIVHEAVWLLLNAFCKKKYSYYFAFWPICLYRYYSWQK